MASIGARFDRWSASKLLDGATAEFTRPNRERIPILQPRQGERLDITEQFLYESLARAFRENRHAQTAPLAVEHLPLPEATYARFWICLPTFDDEQFTVVDDNVAFTTNPFAAMDAVGIDRNNNHRLHYVDIARRRFDPPHQPDAEDSPLRRVSRHQGTDIDSEWFILNDIADFMLARRNVVDGSFESYTSIKSVGNKGELVAGRHVQPLSIPGWDIATRPPSAGMHTVHALYNRHVGVALVSPAPTRLFSFDTDHRDRDYWKLLAYSPAVTGLGVVKVVQMHEDLGLNTIPRVHQTAVPIVKSRQRHIDIGRVASTVAKLLLTDTLPPLAHRLPYVHVPLLPARCTQRDSWFTGRTFDMLFNANVEAHAMHWQQRILGGSASDTHVNTVHAPARQARNLASVLADATGESTDAIFQRLGKGRGVQVEVPDDGIVEFRCVPEATYRTEFSAMMTLPAVNSMLTPRFYAKNVGHAQAALRSPDMSRLLRYLSVCGVDPVVKNVSGNELKLGTLHPERASEAIRLLTRHGLDERMTYGNVTVEMDLKDISDRKRTGLKPVTIVSPQVLESSFAFDS